MKTTIGVVFVAVMLAACASDPGGVAAGDDEAAPDASSGDDIDARPTGLPIDAAPMGLGAPGTACSCDADCADESGHDGVCIFGVCMTEASATCASGGSQAECPTGSRCWALTGYEGGSLCWPDCSAHTCAGTCDGDGSCAPAEGDNCDPSCGAACTCTETSCGDGMSCVGGECVEDVDVGTGPGAGPGPACAGLPTRDCTGATCDDLMTFSPRTNTAWDDYAINGETAANQYRSYLRKDLMMLVSYATSKVACKAAAWSGTARALGLGDMSEVNGAIPGTSIGSPGHPAGTHVNGRDIDLAYYQLGTVDNKLRPICPHTTGGADQYHCTGAPTSLDIWRTAMFLGSVFESTKVRVIGVDGQAGPLLISALDQLCDSGWLSAGACGDVALAYETTNMNLGWYQFHHHHAHISVEPTAFVQLPVTSNVKSIAQRPAGIHRVR